MNNRPTAYIIERTASQRHIDVLTWAYGAKRLAAIVSGHDGPTNMDLKLWKGLGRGK